MDETNVTFHAGNIQVFARPGSKHVTRINPSNKSSCTLVFCVSAIGEVLRVLVVQKGKNPEHCGMVETCTHVSTCFTKSGEGWMNTSLMIEWLVSNVS